VQEIASLIVSDITGRQLYKQEISIEVGNNSYKINNAAMFPNGTYFLSLQTNGQMHSLKFIKN
jgi:hypothetical protein